MAPFVVVILLIPASIDSIGNNRPVGRHNGSDEHHFDVMFHRHKFRIVDPRLLGEFLPLHRNVHLYRREAQLRLVRQQLWPLTSLVDDAMFLRFDAVLLASLTAIRQNGSVLIVSKRWSLEVAVITYTQVECPWSFATTMNLRNPVMNVTPLVSLISSFPERPVRTSFAEPLGSAHPALKIWPEH